MSRQSKKNSKTTKMHNSQWRNPSQVTGQWKGIPEINLKLLKYSAQGDWWSVLKGLKIRLIISREYEHLLIALGSGKRTCEISYFSVPHPSGIAIDNKKKLVFISSTRNPNQVYEFKPLTGIINRKEGGNLGIAPSSNDNSLIPTKTHFYPGSLYIHDLTIIEGNLYANAVGHNAVVQLLPQGGYKYVWWPLCAENKKRLISSANYLQLNSIAAGKTLRDSFFSASSDVISSLRPGHIKFPVDGRGVIFSGKTRQPICKGLTRPHSARLYKGRLWVENSGYGEFGFIDNNKFKGIIKLPGWTRGLCIKEDVAFIGTSKVIPRFYKYAPGLDVKRSVCAIYAVHLKTGKILGSLKWPHGDQIFSIECIPRGFSKGFPCGYMPQRRLGHIKHLFYAFKTQ